MAHYSLDFRVYFLDDLDTVNSTRQTILRGKMAEQSKSKPVPPEISPYLFPVALALMGAWFSYDGWFSAEPDMQEHLIFNRVGSAILLPWAVVDFFRTWRAENEYKRKIVVKNDVTLDDN